MQLYGKGVIGRGSSNAGITVALATLVLSLTANAITVKQSVPLPTLAFSPQLNTIIIKETKNLPTLNYSLTAHAITISNGLGLSYELEAQPITVSQRVNLPVLNYSLSANEIRPNLRVSLPTLSYSLTANTINPINVVQLPLLVMDCYAFPITVKEKKNLPTLNYSIQCNSLTVRHSKALPTLQYDLQLNGLGLKVGLPTLEYDIALNAITATTNITRHLPILDYGLTLNPITPTDYHYRVTIEINGAGFLAGDLLLAERVDYLANGNEDVHYRIYATVVSVSAGNVYDILVDKARSVFNKLLSFNNDNAQGIDFVKIGSTTPSRANLIRFVTLGANAPFIEIAENVDSIDNFLNHSKTKFLSGNLSEITNDSNFGNLAGKYGTLTYNGYFKGTLAGGSLKNLIPVTNEAGYFFTPTGDALIGDMTNYIKKVGSDLDISLQKLKITTPTFKVDSVAETILIGLATKFDKGHGIFIGKDSGAYKGRWGKAGGQRFEWDGENVLIKDKNDDVLFSTSGTASVFTGFDVTESSITKKDDSNKYFGLSSSSEYRFFAGADNADGLNAKYFIRNNGTGRIGGFLFTDTTIASLNDGLLLDGENALIRLTGTNAAIEGNYSPSSGFRLDGKGNAVCNNISIRGAINGGVFSQNVTTAVGGNTIYTKAVGDLYERYGQAMNGVMISIPDSVDEDSFKTLWSHDDMILIKDAYHYSWRQIDEAIFDGLGKPIPINSISNGSVILENDIDEPLQNFYDEGLEVDSYIYVEFSNSYGAKISKIYLSLTREFPSTIGAIVGVKLNSQTETITKTSTMTMGKINEVPTYNYELVITSQNSYQGIYIYLPSQILHSCKVYSKANAVRVTFQDYTGYSNFDHIFKEKTAVINYGNEGGVIELVSNDVTTGYGFPIMRMGKCTADPASGLTYNLLNGNLKGYQGYTTDKFGMIAGRNLENPTTFQGLIAAEDKVLLKNCDFLLGNRTQYHYQSDYASNNQSGIWQGKIPETERYGFYYGDKNNFLRYDGLEMEYGTTKSWTLTCLQNGVKKGYFTIIPSIYDYGTYPCFGYMVKQWGNKTSYNVKAFVYGSNYGFARGMYVNITNDTSETNGTLTAYNDLFYWILLNNTEMCALHYDYTNNTYNSTWNHLKFGTDVDGNQKDITNVNSIKATSFERISPSTVTNLTTNDTTTMKDKINELLGVLRTYKLLAT